jgi:hypothetical protein
MGLHVFWFLLVFFLLCLAVLWRSNWLPLRPSHAPGGAKRTMFHRLLKPRTPDDCPACRLASPHRRLEGRNQLQCGLGAR